MSPGTKWRTRVAALALAIATALPTACRAPAPVATYAPGPDEPGPHRRGGRVLMTREEDPDFLDPGLSYGITTAPIIEVVFHTLIDYRHVPGVAGAGLEPDLADALPVVREGGTLYCFRISKHARFGPPLHRAITAQDFRYAIRRLFRINCPGVSFYRHIVGGEEMLAGRDSSLAGVIARGDSLYIRLTRPDPIFKYLLAMSFVSPIPEEVDRRWPNAFSQHTVPTGPYRVAEFTPRRRVLLVRNPDFEGTPGWLDTIEVRLGVTASNGDAMVLHGRSDGGFYEMPAADFARLRSDPLWSRQISVADGLNTEYLWMNVRKKPFNDPRVRQAVAWALDRRAVLKVWSGKGAIAGEFLPPGMPGVHPLGRYAVRDTARARQLLREAGYPDGFETTLYGWLIEPGPRELAVVQQQLGDVGIRVRLDLGETSGYTSMAGDTTRHIPFGLYSWYADYVDPSNFFDTLLNGHRIEARHNQNLGLFDDPEVNAAIERAMATADDSTRLELYRRVDERVMDLCPVIPMVHNRESRLYHPRLGGWYRHITRILRLEDLYVKTPAPRSPA